MLKKNKWNILISSVIILLPILFGVIMWKDLPDIMTTHFGADGNADGFSGKAFAVFGLPCLLLLLHLVCLLFSLLDKKQAAQNPKALSMIFWIVPMISLVVNGTLYSVALGREVNIALIFPVLIGVPFILMGNYLPKIKQNRTFGIKLWWTLHNEENWNKTHRLGGKVMVAGGFLMLLSSFLPLSGIIITMFCVLILTIFISMLYSYLIYRQHQKEGIQYIAATPSKGEKLAGRITAIIIPIILLGTVILMFTGDVEVKWEIDSFTVGATYYTDLDVDFADIDSITCRKGLDVGIRASGFGSARLSLGIFQNDEFGLYTLYAYTGAEEYVVLTSDGDTLVIGMKEAKDTQAIYDIIISNLSK